MAKESEESDTTKLESLIKDFDSGIFKVHSADKNESTFQSPSSVDLSPVRLSPSRRKISKFAKLN